MTILLAKLEFSKAYGTQDERFYMLPPGVDKNKFNKPDFESTREIIRKELQIRTDENMLLMVGSGFETKGVSRSINAFAQLKDKLKLKSKLFIIGSGKSKPYMKLASELNVSDQVLFLGPRDDVENYFFAADYLLHPARFEAAGLVLLEALVSGLPVIVSDNCGYASHIQDSNSGLLIDSPFQQNDFNNKLSKMLEENNDTWHENAKKYSSEVDLYSMPITAARLIEECVS